MNIRSNKIEKEIIKKKNDEIEELKEAIKRQEEVYSDKSLDSLKEEFENLIKELKGKREIYDKIIGEVTMMYNVMNMDVFNGKWKLVKRIIGI